MIADILDARRPSLTEFLVKTGAGKEVTFRQQKAQMDLSLDGLQVVRTYTVKTGDVAVRIQADLTLLSGNLSRSRPERRLRSPKSRSRAS